MIRSKKRITPIIFLLASLMVYSQKSAVYDYGDNEYLKGLELYENQKYGAAREVFGTYLADHPGSRSEIRSDASFYMAMSAVELRNDDSEFLVYTFISGMRKHPNWRLAAPLTIAKNWRRRWGYSGGHVFAPIVK